jgi:proteasome lid subunit RPN8/RPN11
MIQIENQAWNDMQMHASRAYPEECCGAMLGHLDNGVKRVSRVIPLENAADGLRSQRYEIKPADLLATEQQARGFSLTSIGIYHSHPDTEAYFSLTDLKNSCPWYSFVVLSVREGRVAYARSFLPDADQTRAEEEPIVYPTGDKCYGQNPDTNTPASICR